MTSPGPGQCNTMSVTTTTTTTTLQVSRAGIIEDIQDENVLREMWMEAKDNEAKRQIRFRMYKLREERLKNLYNREGILENILKSETTESESMNSTKQLSQTADGSSLPSPVNNVETNKIIKVQNAKQTVQNKTENGVLKDGSVQSIINKERKQKSTVILNKENSTSMELKRKKDVRESVQSSRSAWSTKITTNVKSSREQSIQNAPAIPKAPAVSNKVRKGMMSPPTAIKSKQIIREIPEHPNPQPAVPRFMSSTKSRDYGIGPNVNLKDSVSKSAMVTHESAVKQTLTISKTSTKKEKNLAITGESKLERPKSITKIKAPSLTAFEKKVSTKSRSSSPKKDQDKLKAIPEKNNLTKSRSPSPKKDQDKLKAVPETKSLTKSRSPSPKKDQDQPKPALDRKDVIKLKNPSPKKVQEQSVAYAEQKELTKLKSSSLKKDQKPSVPEKKVLTKTKNPSPKAEQPAAKTEESIIRELDILDTYLAQRSTSIEEKEKSKAAPTKSEETRTEKLIKNSTEETTKPSKLTNVQSENKYKGLVDVMETGEEPVVTKTVFKYGCLGSSKSDFVLRENVISDTHTMERKRSVDTVSSPSRRKLTTKSDGEFFNRNEQIDLDSELELLTKMKMEKEEKKKVKAYEKDILSRPSVFAHKSATEIKSKVSKSSVGQESLSKDEKQKSHRTVKKDVPKFSRELNDDEGEEDPKKPQKRFTGTGSLESPGAVLKARSLFEEKAQEASQDKSSSVFSTVPVNPSAHKVTKNRAIFEARARGERVSISSESSHATENSKDNGEQSLEETKSTVPKSTKTSMVAFGGKVVESDLPFVSYRVKSSKKTKHANLSGVIFVESPITGRKDSNSKIAEKSSATTRKTTTESKECSLDKKVILQDLDVDKQQEASSSLKNKKSKSPERITPKKPVAKVKSRENVKKEGTPPAERDMSHPTTPRIEAKYSGKDVNLEQIVVPQNLGENTEKDDSSITDIRSFTIKSGKQSDIVKHQKTLDTETQTTNVQTENAEASKADSKEKIEFVNTVKTKERRSSSVFEAKMDAILSRADPTPETHSIDSDKLLEVTNISELEAMLDAASGYYDRSRIRSRIRELKRASNEHGQLPGTHEPIGNNVSISPKSGTPQNFKIKDPPTFTFKSEIEPAINKESIVSQTKVHAKEEETKPEKAPQKYNKEPRKSSEIFQKKQHDTTEKQEKEKSSKKEAKRGKSEEKIKSNDTRTSESISRNSSFRSGELYSTRKSSREEKQGHIPDLAISELLKAQNSPEAHAKLSEKPVKLKMVVDSKSKVVEKSKKKTNARWWSPPKSPTQLPGEAKGKFSKFHGIDTVDSSSPSNISRAGVSLEGAATDTEPAYIDPLQLPGNIVGNKITVRPKVIKPSLASPQDVFMKDLNCVSKEPRAIFIGIAKPGKSGQKADLIETTSLKNIDETDLLEIEVKQTPNTVNKQNNIKTSKKSKEPKANTDVKIDEDEANLLKRDLNQSEGKVSELDVITSSYGVGPTDDDGKPLFGLKALRKVNNQQEKFEKTLAEETTIVTSSETYSEESVDDNRKTLRSNDMYGLRALKKGGSSTTSSVPDGLDTQNQLSPETSERSTSSPKSILKKTSSFSSNKSESRTEIGVFGKDYNEECSSDTIAESSPKTITSSLPHLVEDNTTENYGHDVWKRRSVDPINSSSGSSTKVGRTTVKEISMRYESSKQDTDDNSDEQMKSQNESDQIDEGACSKTSNHSLSTECKESSSKSFLSDKSQVTGISDVLERMSWGNENDDDNDGTGLLNKFLGAQILMQGTESMLEQTKVSKN